MKNERVVAIKTDANYAWVAVLDPASGKRGRYTVYRCYRWDDKRVEVVGRELDLEAACNLVGKRVRDDGAPKQGFDHECDWRTAALKLARCVVWTLQTGGKLGMGTGMVMKVVDGKKTVERWDKDFVEALAFIGIEVSDPKPKKRSPPSPKKPTKRTRRHERK